MHDGCVEIYGNVQNGEVISTVEPSTLGNYILVIYRFNSGIKVRI